MQLSYFTKSAERTDPTTEEEEQVGVIYYIYRQIHR